MKKLLALVLALVMTLSLAVVGSNAAFKDADKVSDTYAEAVDVLAGMKVFQGYTDGTFQPEGSITRAEVAAIVYRLYTADVADKQASLYATYNKFNDMDGAKWAAGYIGYCANAGLVKGYDAKTFGPSNKVTGYEALAMILRAVGYDKNGEFTGAQWQLRVASTAQQLGILDNVKGVDLNAAATRELVAELLFRTATVPMVSYTPAFGYVANSVVGAQKSLGEKNFGLKLTKGTADVWGRPSHTWTYTTGDKKTVVADKAVASYTVKVSECDIAKDLGISTSAKIEAAYIDGKGYTVTDSAVTTDRTGTIDPLATTALVGAQGRITEVYDMGTAGYRIVEVNTYLAKVTKVTAATTDVNGHTTDATVEAEVYMTSAAAANAITKTVLTTKATGFTVGQYVLVTATRDTVTPVIRSIEAATVAPTGLLKTWTYAYGTTAATTTVAETKYNDADKFFLNNIKSTAYLTTAWDTVVDAYGNLIGLVPSTVNYLVVEKISWKHSNTTVAGGSALADIVLADGSKVAGATIASVDSNATTNNRTAVLGGINAAVADDYTNNTAYYKKIFTYSVNTDGSYALVSYCNNNHNTSETTITKGVTSTIESNTNRVVANTNTLFLVKSLTGDTYSYTAYKGINEVPSMKVKATTGNTVGLCYVSDGTYASLVVVNDYELTGNKYTAFVPAQDGKLAGYNASTVYYSYEVYKLGETSATTIYSTSANLFNGQAGFWVINQDAASTYVSTNSVWVMGVYDSDAVGTAGTTASDLYWDRCFVKSYVGGGLVTTAKDGTAYKDYTASGAQFFDVNRTIWADAVTGQTTERTTITANETQAVSAGDKIIVARDSSNVAKYVYVLKTTTNGTTAPTVAPVATISGMGYNTASQNYVVSVSVDQAIAADAYTSYDVIIKDASGNYITSKTFAANGAWNANQNYNLEVPYSASNASGVYTVTLNLYKTVTAGSTTTTTVVATGTNSNVVVH